MGRRPMSTLRDFQSESPEEKYLVYILNNLERSSEFHADLFELFGSEDGSTKGLVGSWDSRRKDFKTACWDWSISNLRHIVNLLYILRKRESREKYDPKEFDNFYEGKIVSSERIAEVLKEEGLIREKLFALYILRYREQFPALIMELKKISWVRGRKRELLLTFQPVKYFILDPSTWDMIKKLCRGTHFWMRVLRASRNEAVREFLDRYSGMQQAIYGLIPLQRFTRVIASAPTLFIKNVERPPKRQVVTDNEIFWEMFRLFTHSRQTTTEVVLRDDYEYRIKDIPINALTERSLVYLQEAGVANVLCHSLLETFGDRYLEEEFRSRKEVDHRWTSVLRRAYPLSQVKGEARSSYADCNYDYLIDLFKLGVKKQVVFGLTTALWRKGHYTPYENFIDKWRYMYFKIPMRHPEYTVVWYITVPHTEADFFEDERHQSFEELFDDLRTKTPKVGTAIVRGPSDIPQISDSQVIAIPLFRRTTRSRNVLRELESLRSRRYRSTLFHGVVKELLEK